MWTSFLLFSILLCVSFGSELELFDQNSWVPVKNDVVYNQIRREFIPAPHYSKVDDVHTTKRGVFSIVTKQYEYVLPYNDVQCHSNKSCINNFYETNNLAKDNFRQAVIQNNKSEITTARRSKILGDISDLNNILSQNNKRTRQNHDLETNHIEDRTQLYEVTEIIPIEDENQAESNTKEKDYPLHFTDQNLASNLIKRLSKYNIKDNDNLRNYDLSRRPRVESLDKSSAFNPLHFRIPVRYNSLNHLPVNPLLAVFLSNYGYYLQGQYGIQNDYKNLYGNLASNNIHNNRPFGFYKLFSDTDSSL